MGTNYTPHSTSVEFPISDEAIDIMADAALGPDDTWTDAERQADEALRLPDDRALVHVDEAHDDPVAVHARQIRDRLRGARLASLPDVREALSQRRRRTFLVALAETGIIGHACARAGWTYAIARGLRKTDAAFAQMWDDAVEFAADSAEAEAFRRGVHGFERDVYFKGEVVGKETVFSDRLLESILKARRPEKFRESHRLEVDTKGGVLVVPSAPSEGDWESSATAGQAKFREAPDD